MSSLIGSASVAQGGTGRVTLTAGYFILGNDASAVTLLAPPISVSLGGTGVATLASGQLLLGNGTGAITTLAIPTGGLVGVDATQTLTNKTLTSPSINGAVMDNTGVIVDGSYTNAIGFRGVPQVPQNTDYTLVLADRGRHIYSKNTGAQVIYIPNSGSVNYSIGSAITIVNNGTSNITINAATAGVTLRQAGTSNTGNRTLAQYGEATILKVESDVWFISGLGLT